VGKRSAGNEAGGSAATPRLSKRKGRGTEVKIKEEKSERPFCKGGSTREKKKLESTGCGDHVTRGSRPKSPGVGMQHKKPKEKEEGDRKDPNAQKKHFSLVKYSSHEGGKKRLGGGKKIWKKRGGVRL